MQSRQCAHSCRAAAWTHSVEEAVPQDLLEVALHGQARKALAVCVCVCACVCVCVGVGVGVVLLCVYVCMRVVRSTRGSLSGRRSQPIYTQHTRHRVPNTGALPRSHSSHCPTLTHRQLTLVLTALPPSLFSHPVTFNDARRSV